MCVAMHAFSSDMRMLIAVPQATRCHSGVTRILAYCSSWGFSITALGIIFSPSLGAEWYHRRWLEAKQNNPGSRGSRHGSIAEGYRFEYPHPRRHFSDADHPRRVLAREIFRFSGATHYTFTDTENNKCQRCPTQEYEN